MSREDNIQLAKKHLDTAKDFYNRKVFWQAETELILANYYLKDMPISEVESLIIKIKDLKAKVKKETDVFKCQTTNTL